MPDSPVFAPFPSSSHASPMHKYLFISFTMTAYQSISVDEEEPRSSKRNSGGYVRHIVGFLILALITASFALSRWNDNDGKEKSSAEKKYLSSSTNVPVPAGVNLGSWVRKLLVYHSIHTIITQSSLTNIIHIICSHTRSSPSKIGFTSVTMAQ